MGDEILSQDEIESLIAQAGQGDAASGNDSKAAGDVQEMASDTVVDVVEAAQQTEPVVRPVKFNPVTPSIDKGGRSGVDLIMDVQLQVRVELGRAILQVRDVLGLGPGSVVELDKHAGEPVEVVVNNKTVARGEVVVIDENFGVRITEIVDSKERETRAKAA